MLLLLIASPNALGPKEIICYYFIGKFGQNLQKIFSPGQIIFNVLEPENINYLGYLWSKKAIFRLAYFSLLRKNGSLQL